MTTGIDNREVDFLSAKFGAADEWRAVRDNLYALLRGTTDCAVVGPHRSFDSSETFFAAVRDEGIHKNCVYFALIHTGFREAAVVMLNEESI